MLSTIVFDAQRVSRRVLVPMLALPLLASAPVYMAPVQAYAATAAASQESSLSVKGIDTFNVGGGDSFECATVSGLGDGTLYADVSVGDKVLKKDMTYAFDSASDTFGVVQLNKKASYIAEHSGDITLDFYAAKSAERADASPLLSATVYAVCIQVDGKPVGSVSESMIAIRTAAAADATLAIEAPSQIVRGTSTYNLVGSGKVTPTLKDGVLYVSYEKADEGTTTVDASVLYVDENGNTLKCDSYTIAADEQKSVTLRTSIEVDGKTYAPMAKVKQVTLSADAPEQRVYCVARAEADNTTKDVTLTYESTEGKQLMVDRVNVGAGGFLYAPAAVFSQAHDVEVSRYVLTGAKDNLGNTYTAKQAAKLSLTRDGAETYTLYYKAEQTELAYTVNFALVSAGKNGNTEVNVTKSATAKVSAKADASIDLPKTIEQDGVTYTRFGTDETLSYAWADLSAGRALSDTVYYVASDVVTPVAYDVTVRYVDAVSGTLLGSKTVTCEADGSAVSITSPESVTFGGKEYERLSGQSAEIAHRFYDPYRIYTIYYALPGSMSAGDVTVTRTVVVDGGVRRYTIDAEGNVSGTDSNGAGGLITTAPYTSVTTQASSSDADDNDSSADASQTGDVTAPSGESAYEERISDNETPLASGKEDRPSVLGAPVIAGVATAAVLLIALVAAFFKKRRTADGTNDVKGA